MAKARLVVIPNALTVARLRKTMTPRELAQQAGYTPERIYQFEAGSAIGIAPDRARRLAEVLGVAVEDITKIEHPQEQAS